jgi:hypothetical protein
MLSVNRQQAIALRLAPTFSLLKNINLRLANSVTARNGISERENAREIATMLYGEVHPYTAISGL